MNGKPTEPVTHPLHLTLLARDGKIPLYWALFILLTGSAWYFYYRLHLLLPPSTIIYPLGIFLVAAFLTLLLGRALSAVRISLAWRYRSAFLAGLLTSLAIVLFSLAVRSVPPTRGSLAGSLAAVLLVLPIAASIGAFLGGLILTGLEIGWWENNAPPPELCRQQVLYLHLQRIGDPPPETAAIRSFDLLLGLFAIVLTSPFWLFAAFLIWLEDPGPVVFIKNSVGRGGCNFLQLKFRTMVAGAEEATGPVLAKPEDERVLRFGRLLRKSALDELPQLINIIKGEMSFVGPRPQRTVLVYDYLQSMPEYADRHRVSPGLAGLAQVAGDYFLSPRQKLRFDCLYIAHRCLRFNLKLFFLATLITFWYRWQPGWNGRLPRSLLHS